MANYQKKLLVEPGRKVGFTDLDPDYHGKHESEKDAKVESEATLVELTELQRLLYADRKHALLIVLQGLDAAGKDGVCWHIIKAMNPQGTAVVSFKQPTPEERKHDFLRRVHSRRVRLLTPRGTQSPPTTSGFATSRWPRSSAPRWSTCA